MGSADAHAQRDARLVASLRAGARRMSAEQARQLPDVAALADSIRTQVLASFPGGGPDWAQACARDEVAVVGISD